MNKLLADKLHLCTSRKKRIQNHDNTRSRIPAAWTPRTVLRKTAADPTSPEHSNICGQVFVDAGTAAHHFGSTAAQRRNPQSNGHNTHTSARIGRRFAPLTPLAACFQQDQESPVLFEDTPLFLCKPSAKAATSTMTPRAAHVLIGSRDKRPSGASNPVLQPEVKGRVQADLQSADLPIWRGLNRSVCRLVSD